LDFTDQLSFGSGANERAAKVTGLGK